VAGPAPGTIFVTNDGNGPYGTGSVTEYAAGDSGNVHPVLTISRGVFVSTGLAFDASGDLWVANGATNTVVEYRKSELATVSPAPFVIISSSPGDAPNQPAGIAFDSSGNLWVDNADTVTEYTEAELAASGSPAPRVTITNAGLFHSEGPYGLAVDPSGDLWVEGSPSANADAVCE
jgi:sugar lactone lactonase YvrE